MSRLVARILLSLLVFPLALVCFGLMIVVMASRRPREEEGALIVADVITFIFICAYWTLVWRKSVRWTLGRFLVPYGVAIGFGVIAVVVLGNVTFRVDREPLWILMFLGVSVAWLLTTIFLWQETPLERGERLQMSNRSNISCPSCGYNLTGLNEARCPECGAKFTLDELFASQPRETVGGIE